MSDDGMRCPHCGCDDLLERAYNAELGRYIYGYTTNLPGNKRRKIRICRHCGRRVRIMEAVEA